MMTMIIVFVVYVCFSRFVALIKPVWQQSTMKRLMWKDITMVQTLMKSKQLCSG